MKILIINDEPLSLDIFNILDSDSYSYKVELCSREQAFKACSKENLVVSIYSKHPGALVISNKNRGALALAYDIVDYSELVKNLR